MNFEEADKKVHPVESQWHYETMTRYGFIPETKEAVGFVRSYIYKHTDGHEFEVTTGFSRDYWVHKSAKHKGVQGLWRELEPYLKTLTAGSQS